MPETFLYDVFLSHSAKDNVAMRRLADRLRRDGLRVWFDDPEVSLGSMIGHVIDEAMESSRTLVLAVSRHSVESEWTALESGSFRFRDPANSARRFIPLRLDDTEMKAALQQFAYVDWRQESDEQYATLLAACQPPTHGRTDRDDSVAQPEAPVLSGHTSFIYSLAITPDGRSAVSGANDWTTRLWDLESRRCIAVMKGHQRDVTAVAITADGRLGVSGSYDHSVRLWDLHNREQIAVLEGHKDRVRGVALTSDGRSLLSISDDNTLRVWSVESEKCLALISLSWPAHEVSITADGRRALISGGSTLALLDIDKAAVLCSLTGHFGQINGIDMTPDGRFAVSASEDHTVRLWDLTSQKCLAALEGHTDGVTAAALTHDGQRVVSSSRDRTIRVWSAQSGRCVLSLKGHTDAPMQVAITANGARAVSVSRDRTVRVWNLPSVSDDVQQAATTRYTNAKVLLVGESGVGKTGLLYRLTEGCFKSSVSTDAAWATQLKLPSQFTTDDIEREVWLWDFAGQADYRLIHQLYMDETALALLVFNPQSDNPFESLGQWDRDLERAARRPYQKLLVAGRIDRGGLMISKASIERFRQERGFAGYVETSALIGTGCDALRDGIVAQIDWENIPWTASPRIFRLLKDEIIRLKEEGKVVLRVIELKQQLEMRLIGEHFTIEQLRAVLALLASPGVVWQLEFGDFILLQPERINAYASAVIRSVRAHTEEIGCVAEEEVLAGSLDYQDMRRLLPDEEQIVLRAMHQTFVNHGLCLREHTEQGTLLVFPSYFKRERPEPQDQPVVLVTYEFAGPLDEIYATLVVKLYHTAPFAKDRLWRFAADFLTHSGGRLGLRLLKKAEGRGELEVYCEPGIADDVQITFIRYIHEHLNIKARDVRRIRHYVCARCNTPVENRKAVDRRLAEGKRDIICGMCEHRVKLIDLIEEKFATDEFLARVRGLEEQAKSAIDNESRELILVGHAYAIAGEAGQIFRQYSNSDHGIDGEIEFKDHNGEASGKRVYLQLKSGDSYLRKRRSADADGDEVVFTIRKHRHVRYWQNQAYPVMLVIRTSDGQIRWMDVSDYLKREQGRTDVTKQIVFKGEPFTALVLRSMRERILGQNVQ